MKMTMLQIKDEHDKRFFKTLLAFVQAGGNINQLKQMQSFCHKYDIKPEQFAKVIREEGDTIIDRLRRVGLI